MDAIVRLADALWRAATYVSVAQLHLESNPLLTEPLTAAQVKERPSGHWGTVPGNAFVLSHLALASARVHAEVMPVLGAGHAGVVQVAMAWLTGDLAAVRPRFSPDAKGLGRLVESFPDLDGLGAEVSPLLPGGSYLGGQLGGAFAFAQGAGLDSPGRVVVPILGDGECETPTTAAAWLATRAMPARAAVVPIVHLNGYRMGGRSLLATMGDEALRAYATGLGWQPVIVHVDAADAGEHRDFHAALLSAIIGTLGGVPTVIFLRCPKGWSGPAKLAGRTVVGTPRAHKTPLTSARQDPEQLVALQQWLASYRPAELFSASGTAIGALAEAVQLVRGYADPPTWQRRTPIPARPAGTLYGTFTDAVSAVLHGHSRYGDFLLLSPDELASNQLGHLVCEPWAIEVLAEEVLLGWLAGWTATGRRGLLISYEAFAPLLTTGLLQLLKQRRLVPAAERPPSLNLLLTSYGWHNSYTHGDPSLTTALLASRDPALRVLTPADPHRLAAALDTALSSVGQVNVIIAGKHATAQYPHETLDQECRRGLAVWPHASDDGEPEVVLVAAGDLPAAVACAAAQEIRRRLRVRVRVVGVHDLTVLGHPAIWPSGLSDAEVRQYFGTTAPVVIATLGHPAAVWGLIEDRLRRPVEVVGWREPNGPTSQHSLAATAGMDVAGLCAAAARLRTAGNIPGDTRTGIKVGGQPRSEQAAAPVPRWPVNGVAV